MSVLDVIDRKAAIRVTQPASVVKQRIAEAAASLNRAGNMAMRVEIANEALAKFTAILYQRDTDGAWANVDRRTHRLLVPAPWGSAGWRAWGLRKWEATVLRGIMLGRVSDKKRPCLFDYNSDMRLWYLNLVDYGVFDAAQHYLARSPITLAEWRRYTEAYTKT